MERLHLPFVTLLVLACGGADRPAPASPEGEGRAGLAAHEVPSSRRSMAPPLDDEGDDDGDVSVSGLRGHLDPADIQRGISPHAGKLAECYQSKLGQRHFIGGKVTLAFRLDRAGVVKVAQIAQSDLGSWSMERCLLEIARVIAFSAPRGGEAEFSVPLDFTAHARVAWWDEERADTEVGDRLGELAACATASGASDPQNVWVTLYVGARGKVQSVGFASPAAAPLTEAWATCASAAVGAWQLSDPRGRVAKMGFRYNPE